MLSTSPFLSPLPPQLNPNALISSLPISPIPSYSMGKIRSFFRRRSGSKHGHCNVEALTPTSSASSPSPSPSPPPNDAPVSMNGVGAEELERMFELERVFKKFDRNGDGRISRAEMAEIFESLGQPVTEEELNRMMGEVDADGDGFISVDEFTDLMACEVDQAAHEQELRHAFDVFDVDRNGAISADEICRVLRSLGEAASIAQCRKMIDGVDQDGDGMVSFEEFKIMMAKNGGKMGLPRNN